MVPFAERRGEENLGLGHPFVSWTAWPAHIDVGEVDLVRVYCTREPELPLQPPDGKLDDLHPICPQPEAAQPASEPWVRGDLVGAAGDTIAGAPEGRREIAERRVMALRVVGILVGEDVGVGDSLHQPAADIRWPGALPHGPPETERAQARRRISDDE